MKKSLIALAALATVGAAQAQSSVTVYGVLDAGYSETERTVGTTKNGQNAFSFSNYTSSRFGLRGNEDLGGGMRASFIIETGIGSHPMAGFYQAASTGDSTKAGTTIDATSVGGRELSASISTAQGTTVGIGFGTTAVRRLVLGYDAAGGTNLIGNVLTNDVLLSSNRSNGLGVSQKLGDFTVGAGMTRNVDTKDATADLKTSTGHILSLDYAKGKLAFGAARQESKSNTLAGATTYALGQLGNAATGNNDTCSAPSAATTLVNSSTGIDTTSNTCIRAVAGADATNTKRTIDIAGASYDLGFAKLFAQYAKVKLDDAATTNQVGEGTRTATTLGVAAPVGKWTLHALVSEGNQNMVVTKGTAAVKRDLSGYNLGARYALSKRTFGYAAYGETKLDGTSGTTDQFKTQQTTVGLVHSF